MSRTNKQRNDPRQKCYRKTRLDEGTAEKIVVKFLARKKIIVKYFCEYCHCWHVGRPRQAEQDKILSKHFGPLQASMCELAHIKEL